MSRASGNEELAVRGGGRIHSILDFPGNLVTILDDRITNGTGLANRTYRLLLTVHDYSEIFQVFTDLAQRK